MKMPYQLSYFSLNHDDVLYISAKGNIPGDFTAQFLEDVMKVSSLFHHAEVLLDLRDVDDSSSVRNIENKLEKHHIFAEENIFMFYPHDLEQIFYSSDYTYYESKKKYLESRWINM